MSWLRILRTRFRALFRKRQLDAEMDEEMRSHLELRTQANIEAGMNPEEARFAALRQFGWTESIKEECRDQRGVRWLESFFQDIRYGARQLRKNPGFTAVAVLTLALGIGANTAVFSGVYSMLMKPLPFPDSDRLVGVHQMLKRHEWRRSTVSVPEFHDVRAQATGTFDGLAALANASFTLTGRGDATRLPGETVSHDYFATLGVAPSLGRAFVAEEDAAPNQARVVIVSDDLWRSRFASDPEILGQTIQLDGYESIVIGVMPPGFRGLNHRAQAWVPLAIGGASLWDNRGGRWLELVGRLKSGVTLEQARAELKTVIARLAAANPTPNTEISADLAPLREELFGRMQQPLLVLFGAVGFVLAVTCANVAHLMMVRLAGRRREIAIRLSLGASRASLARLCLGESVGICLLGAAVGGVFAWYLLGALKRLAPINLSDGLISLGLNWPAFLFAFAAALVCALAVGALPALLAARTNLDSALKEGDRGGHGGTRGARLRAALVAGEIAVSLVLLFASTLLVRSFLNLVTQTPGYRTEKLVLQRVSLVGERHDAASMKAFVREVLERASAVPGVASVALSSDTPLDGEANASFFTAETELTGPAANEGRAYLHSVTPAFFQTLGIPIRRGELLAESYGTDSERVAIVSESLARRFWPEGDAVGRRIRIGRGEAAPWTRIIGIAAETRYRRFTDSGADDPDVYLPLDQRPVGFLTIAAHTRGDESLVVSRLRSVIRAMDPHLPVVSSTIEERIDRVTVGQRWIAQMMGAFAVFVVALAGIGLYGVVSFAVGQRTREIGVRMALGARPADMVRMVFLGTGRLVVAGMIAGMVLLFIVGRFMESLLFGVNSHDPVTVGTSAVALALMALLAAWLPARRAARVDPMVALRAE